MDGSKASLLKEEPSVGGSSTSSRRKKLVVVKQHKPKEARPPMPPDSPGPGAAGEQRGHMKGCAFACMHRLVAALRA